MKIPRTEKVAKLMRAMLDIEKCAFENLTIKNLNMCNQVSYYNQVLASLLSEVVLFL